MHSLTNHSPPFHLQEERALCSEPGMRKRLKQTIFAVIFHYLPVRKLHTASLVSKRGDEEHGFSLTLLTGLQAILLGVASDANSLE